MVFVSVMYTDVITLVGIGCYVLGYDKLHCLDWLLAWIRFVVVLWELLSGWWCMLVLVGAGL